MLLATERVPPPEPPEEIEPVLAKPVVETVSELNERLKGEVEGRFSSVWVQGEISNFKIHSSGHYYFSLKDSKSQINAMMFRGTNGRVKFAPQDGMEVIVRGKLSVYLPRGTYSINCESMEPVGLGALQLAFDQLKAKLQKEGLFSLQRKRTLPPFPSHVALITSPTGAAIRDMVNVLSRRSRGLKITVIPAVVQGEQAPASLVQSLLLAQKLAYIDVIIIGRGGGSMEDLWAFNDEGLARAIFQCRVPVISAVGHEVDFTISDFVADLRAPTPSAAAELVVKNSAEVIETLLRIQRSLISCTHKFFQEQKTKVLHIGKRLIDPQRLLQDAFVRNDELLERMTRAHSVFIAESSGELRLLRQQLVDPRQIVSEKQSQLRLLNLRLRESWMRRLTQWRARWQESSAVLDSVSPLKVVGRGYAIVNKNNKVVRQAKDLQVGDPISVKLAQGSVDAIVEKIRS